MMKTLCAAVVVLLSLTSVCQPASLACERLLKPVDKGPAISGTWYLIAASTDSCLATALAKAFLLLSLRMDLTPKGAPNVYDTNFKVNLFGLCGNDTEQYFYENNKFFDVDSNNAPYGDPDVLLQSGCPDCIVLKGDEAISTVMLFSRRQTITAAELKEFEGQTECLGWFKPLVFNTDHDYDNCPSIDDVDDDHDTSGLQAELYKRLRGNYKDIIRCIFKAIFDYFLSAVKEWIEGLW